MSLLQGIYEKLEYRPRRPRLQWLDRMIGYRLPRVLVMNAEESYALSRLLESMRPSQVRPATVVEGQGCLINVLRDGMFFSPEAVDAVVTADGQLGIQFSRFGDLEDEEAWPMVTVEAKPLLEALCFGPGALYQGNELFNTPLWMDMALLETEVRS